MLFTNTQKMETMNLTASSVGGTSMFLNID